MTLKTRLIGLVTGALLISLAAGGALIAAAASRWVQAEIDTDARLARELAQERVAEAAEETESADRIVALMHSLEEGRHLRARYLPVAGAQTAITPDADGDGDNDLSAADQAPSWLAALLGVHSTVQEIAAPTKTAPAGRIVIITDPAGEISKVWRLIEIGIVAIALFSASTLLLVAAGLTRSLRPLGDLAAALSRVGGGDYSARIGAGGPTEIALLGRHFDAMAEQLQQMQRRTRALTAQLVAVQERERREIARDLHDELGPCLLAANLDVSALIRLNQGRRRDAVEDCARGLGGALDRMQAQVRRMIGRLHLASAEPFDLGAAVADLVGFWRERCPEMAWRVAPWDDWPELPPGDAAPLFRIVQEAVTNAVRHSGARTITIECGREGDDLVIRVRDDGSGFAPNAGGGYGLPGMRDRIEALGGSLTVETAPGCGTAIAARLRAPAENPATGRRAA